jgi:hypothetical protein
MSALGLGAGTAERYRQSRSRLAASGLPMWSDCMCIASALGGVASCDPLKPWCGPIARKKIITIIIAVICTSNSLDETTAGMDTRRSPARAEPHDGGRFAVASELVVLAAHRAAGSAQYR